MNDNCQNVANVPEVLDLAKLEAQKQRSAQQANVDGSFDLGWGTAMLCSGLGPYFNAILPKTVWAAWWTAWIGYLPLICFAFAPYGIPKMIKRFITWPRTGFVANPNDVKLIQLVMLMGFGIALGFSIALPIILVSEIREAINHPDVQGNLPGIIWHSIKLLVCAALAVYLGRKIITKRQPRPAASESVLIQQQLGQTVAGKQCLRRVKFTVLLMFVGLPILAGGAVFGVIYWHKLATGHGEIQWPQLSMLNFFVATNAILYLMGNAVAIRQHWWKWLALAAMVTGPIIIAPLIPYPAAKPELTPIFEGFPSVMLCLGSVWFLSGLTALILFIRRNPPRVTESA